MGWGLGTGRPVGTESLKPSGGAWRLTVAVPRRGDSRVSGVEASAEWGAAGGFPCPSGVRMPGGPGHPGGAEWARLLGRLLRPEVWPCRLTVPASASAERGQTRGRFALSCASGRCLQWIVGWAWCLWRPALASCHALSFYQFQFFVLK